ncbi:DUF2637 domain-containing protein [Asanoa sp. WMMD1127]|uniref:DUF2637 domain-containing protein n=1 Tax=Asanoa sp. WMMD1127 TaxID=3016107 RepID=UPI0024177723|nr:DUF2637 domain-containing protein [Asanoa sp. WMMD1127]MDG4824908.1 DUF2637 domain-containing protein [Asanoa sp. WMMD1127]
MIVGMAVAAASAATASFTGLRGLALLAGWPERLAWLLPITIDAYAMTAARVWLSGPHGERGARRFARANAIGAIMASIVGNAVYHLVAAGLVLISWPVVVLVGAVPAAVLGLTAHLHALRTIARGAPTHGGTDPGTRDQAAAPARFPIEDRTQDRTESRPTDRPRPRPRRRVAPRTDDALMEAARRADTEHRAAHNGRPITRDALRKKLRVAGPKATEIRRQLASESGTAADDTVTPERKEVTPTP